MVPNWFNVALDRGEELALKPHLWLIYIDEKARPLFDVMTTGAIADRPLGPTDDPRTWAFPYIGVTFVHEYLETGDRIPRADPTTWFISWRQLVAFDPLQRFHPMRALDVSRKP